MQSVYLETTIPSYLAARPSRNPVMALHQKFTHNWWNHERHRFYLYSSLFVTDEVSDGDPSAAAQRLRYLEDIPELPITTAIKPLATNLATLLALPPKAVVDASHLAMVIVHRIDYLLTWNCTHLANPVLQKNLVEYCHYHSLHVPIICTPELLISTRQ